MKTVIVINNDQMGHGDAVLGLRILRNFLRKSAAMNEVTAIVLYNGGVKLATRTSPVLAELQQLHEAGVDIRPCGTCVEHFGLQEAIAVSPSSTDEIVRELQRAQKVITL